MQRMQNFIPLINNQLMKLIYLVFLILVIKEISACKGKPDIYPTIDSNFTKVATHLYGQKYVYHNTQIDHTYYMIKVWGTSYQAGFAYGKLMSQEIKENIDTLWRYYYTLAEEEFKFITKVPEKYQPMARTFAIKLFKGLLMANHYVTRPYTPKRFLDQYAGISAGSGVEINKLIEINMIPEYTRAGCSILGAWGKATKSGKLVQLRALDWDNNNPMNKFPLIVVYNLTEKGSKPFVNVGWTGFVGSITGFSENVGVSEKVRKQDPVKQNETRMGKPWTYAVRDVLQFTDNIDASLKELSQTKRTCSIYLGIGSNSNNTFRLIEYSHKQFQVYDDKNFPFTSTHVKMEGVVFMPYHDNQDPCFNDLLVQKYGQIDAEWMASVLAPSHKTGNTQMAAFDFDTHTLILQVSYNGKLSYDRPMIRIPLKKFLLPSNE